MLNSYWDDEEQSFRWVVVSDQKATERARKDLELTLKRVCRNIPEDLLKQYPSIYKQINGS